MRMARCTGAIRHASTSTCCPTTSRSRTRGPRRRDQDPDQRVWGFESNYGGLGELCVAKGYQLMPKPEHLTWEEAACMPLVNCTAYRMLVSPNGAQMRQGDVVLIWGASGGLGGFALQYVLNGGGYPVCVVSSPEKAEKCRAAGAEWVIDRAAEGFRFWNEDGGRTPRSSCGWARRSAG